MPRKKKGSASSKEKGEVVERIAAMMHEEPGVKVWRDVHMPAKNDASRSRQIDVLLVGETAGYSTTLAIECKNYKRNIDVTDIGKFKDLLEDVGLAPTQGILISAGKIGMGAVSRAKELGMKVFELSGLTSDRLSEALHEALQVTVFVVLSMSELSVVNAVDAQRTSAYELFTLFDADGNEMGSLQDLLWLRWLKGDPPSVLGEHKLELEIPKEWHMQVRGRRQPVYSASAKVKIYAAVVEYAGTSSSLALVDPNNREVQRLHNTAYLKVFGEHPVSVFEEESELEAFVEDRQAALKVVVGRIRAPRIQVNHIYWPPSERVMRRGRQYYKFYKRGRIGFAEPKDFAGVEGSDLSTLWEPIATDQPALELLKRVKGS